MDEFFDSQKPDTPTPINSDGDYKNAAGDFNLRSSLKRKVKSREDLSQPKFSEDDAIKRYFGDFSIESKRHIYDLLKKHPMFSDENGIRLNRVQNNTREVLKKDPTKIVDNGGHIVYEQQPQASQSNY